MRTRQFVGLSLICAALTFADGRNVFAQTAIDADRTQFYVDSLIEQGVSPGDIIGIDSNGIPLVCGTQAQDISSIQTFGVDATMIALPAGRRGYESIPSVIRPDGVDGFFFEVDTNGPVNQVTLVPNFGWVVPGQAFPGDSSEIPLQDLGINGDRIAGDSIYTIGPITFDPTWNGLVGLFNPDQYPQADFKTLGIVYITELDGSKDFGFLALPEVGLLRPDIPADAPVTHLSADIQATPHFINIKSDLRAVANFMLSGINNLPILSSMIYAVLPDRFDFLNFVSLNRVEKTPWISSSNFVTGLHAPLQVNYEGTGMFLQDASHLYNSAGKLLGVNTIAAGKRGINADNMTHEILHQWASFAAAPFATAELPEGYNLGVHYSPRSNVGSTIGGCLWEQNLDGSYSAICPQIGPGGAFHAAPIDLYMMGIVGPGAVPPILVYDNSVPPNLLCISGPNEILPSDIQLTVTIEQIQAAHGPRVPGPASSQREFRMAFIGESHNRLLNDVEMKFYDILAQSYVAPVPDGDPDPFVCTYKWTSIERYFGDGVSFSTEIFDPPTEITFVTSQSLEHRFFDGTLNLITYMFQGSDFVFPDPNPVILVQDVPTTASINHASFICGDYPGTSSGWTETQAVNYTISVGSKSALLSQAVQVDWIGNNQCMVTVSPFGPVSLDLGSIGVLNISPQSSDPIMVQSEANSGGGQLFQARFLLTAPVATPEQTIEETSATITEFSANSVINSGNAKSLLMKLASIQKAIDRDDLEAACEKIQGFIDQVNNFIADGQISFVEGQALIDAATDLEGLVGC